MVVATLQRVKQRARLRLCAPSQPRGYCRYLTRQKADDADPMMPSAPRKRGQLYPRKEGREGARARRRTTDLPGPEPGPLEPRRDARLLRAAQKPPNCRVGSRRVADPTASDESRRREACDGGRARGRKREKKGCLFTGREGTKYVVYYVLKD